jgi:hypothetical protein
MTTAHPLPQAQRMPVLLSSMGTGSVGLTAPQRAAALKELCVSALGPQLFDLLYSVMHKRMAQVRRRGMGVGGDGGCSSSFLNS